MRFLGPADYYDGTAFPSDGNVLSMLVYRREGNRVIDARGMSRLLGLRMRPPVVVPAPMLCRPSLLDLARSFAPPRLRRPCRIASFSRGDASIAFDAVGALFCGTLRMGVVVTTTGGWSPRRDVVMRDWCWTAEDLREATASHGLRPDLVRDRGWFGARDVSEAARRAGLVVATLDPNDPHATRGSWRIDAPTLGGMRFCQQVPPREALTRLATWMGGGDDLVVPLRTPPGRAARRSAA